MKTLNLEEAASFLKMTPETLRKKAINREVPGAKPGKRWCFCEDDLAEYLRSLYHCDANTSWGVVGNRRTTIWHSAKEVTSGGLGSAMVEKEYNKALELATK